MGLIGIEGRFTLETFRAGRCTGRATARNIVCEAGLSDLATAIGWAGAQDQADLIGASPAYLTPLYGAVGIGTSPPYAATATTTVNSTSLTLVTPDTGVYAGLVATGSGIPEYTTVTSDPGSGTVTLSAPATASAAGVSVTFGTSTADTTLYSELDRVQVSAVASTPSGGSGSSTIWQFQFPIQTATYTLTEAGIFCLASNTANSGDMLDHALILPAFTWTQGDTMTLAAQLTWNFV